MLKASLRIKVLLLFLLVSLIPLIAASVFQLNYFDRVIQENIQEQESRIAQDCTSQMNMWIEKKVSQLNGILKAYPEFKQLDKKQAVVAMKALSEIDSDLETPAVVDKDGKGLNTVGANMELAERDYFKEVKSKKSLVISDILASKVSGKKIIMIAVPIIDDSGNFQGALLSPVLIESLEKIVGNIKEKKSGYGALLTSKGNFIFHPNKEMLGKSYEEFSKNPGFIKAFKDNILIKDTGSVTYTDDSNIEKIVFYEKVAATGWELIVVVPVKEAFESLTTTFYISISVLAGALILVILISIFVARMIAKPIISVTELSKKAAVGDFSGRLHLKREDEIGKLASNINSMFDALSAIINNVKGKSDKLDSSSSNLSSTSEQIAASSQEVASAIQETAKGAAEQAKDLDMISDMLEKFNNELNNIHSLLLNVNESTELTEKLSNDGNSQLNDLTKSIQDIKKAFEVELKNINELNINIQKIDEITSLIKSISDQTNMLALNAAIEAARAGESGKGFAVVAEEIRKLAEQSRHSTEGIAQIVKTIMGGTQEIVATSNEVENRLSSQIDTVSLTTKSFEGILQSVLETVPRVKKVFAKMNNLVKDKDRIIEKVGHLSEVAQQTMATAEEVSASAQEMTAATQEISSMSQDLQNVAVDLNDSVKVFKT